LDYFACDDKLELTNSDDKNEKLTHKMRWYVVWLVEWKWFDRIVLIIIVANTICMAMFDNSYRRTGKHLMINTILEDIEWIFIICFSIEAMLKIITKGAFKSKNT